MTAKEAIQKLKESPFPCACAAVAPFILSQQAEIEKVRQSDFTHIYCSACGAHQPVRRDAISKDDLNPFPWGDLCCSKCSLVIATVSREK